MTCDHDSLIGIDTKPGSDPTKVWECCACGQHFRYERYGTRGEVRRVEVTADAL